MKKLCKSAFIVLIIGIIVVAAGVGMGGKIHYPNPLEQYESSSDDNSDLKKYVFTSDEFENENIQAVDITVDATEVKVKSGESWHISYYSNDDKLVKKVEQKDGINVLRLSQKYNNHVINLKRSNIKLVVTVPKDSNFEYFKLSGDSSSVDISDRLKAKKIQLKGDMVNIKAAQLDAKQLHLSGDTSTFDISARVLDKCTVEGDTSSLNITLLDGSNISKIIADTDMTSVKINGEKLSHSSDGVIFDSKADGGTMKIDADMSKINITVPDSGGSHIKHEKVKSKVSFDP